MSNQISKDQLASMIFETLLDETMSVDDFIKALFPHVELATLARSETWNQYQQTETDIARALVKEREKLIAEQKDCIQAQYEKLDQLEKRLKEANAAEGHARDRASHYLEKWEAADQKLDTIRALFEKGIGGV